ncbi:FAD-binding oxidoreductase [Simiduia sp. 21SJ11W-1]|uniref:FAD-binding oxidoreductase n=1 Tax=Simiduia sp. 21SJ11W-1 TaxID=2909669 RepID=UPI00209EFA42|nr:FAD-binding oxidoreductase [Simiduia sp. 21SJ11W-1]UTA48085.1 FAD-binding oxidoreductase [Simiduia sp. 21SJ11W-1]
MSNRQIILAVALSGALIHTGLAAELTPFTTDGCSRFPDGTLEQPHLWRTCCTAHDAAYWAGGEASHRAQADADLAQCVANKGQPSVSALMMMGVRVGGSPFIPSSFRWGYGWPMWRGYAPLTPEEQAKVRALWPQPLPLPTYLQAPVKTGNTGGAQAHPVP